MDITSLENRVTNLYIQYNSIKTSLENNQASIRTLNNQIQDYISNRDLLENSKPYIDDLIDKFSETALKRLEDLLSLGLARIFQDRDYSVEIRVSEKRSAKCAELYLIDDGHAFLMRDSCVAGGILEEQKLKSPLG